MRHYDHVIFGTGQATGSLLGALLGSGESIAVIEGDRVGGTCVNTGCTPTKTLVASARVAHLVGRAGEYGLRTGPVDVDYAAVRARMNRVRDNSGMVEWISGSENVTLFRAWAHFEGPRRLRVGDESISADQIYVNAGARPRVPDIPGLDSVPWLDNGRLLELEELPDHLIVLGGGYIGLEFAQIFRRFGSGVTVIETGPRLASREDEDVSEAIQAILEGEGVEICLDSEVARVRPSAGGLEVELTSSGGERRVSGSHLLVSVGRVPNGDRIGAEAGGIELDERGYVIVDDHCRTTAEGVYALGDINGHGAFTHTSVNDAEIVLDLRRGGDRTLSARIPIYALFIDPPLGRVGLTERQARERGHDVLKATRPMSRISRAKEMGETRGFAKLVVDAATDRILGAAILGPGGDEVVNMFAAFMTTGRPCSEFRKSVLVHPTISELMPWILDGLEPA